LFLIKVRKSYSVGVILQISLNKNQEIKYVRRFWNLIWKRKIYE